MSFQISARAKCVVDMSAMPPSLLITPCPFIPDTASAPPGGANAFGVLPTDMTPFVPTTVNELSATNGEVHTAGPKKIRRARPEMKKLTLDLSVNTDAYRADNKAAADAVLAITSHALKRENLLSLVGDALSVVDDEGVVDLAQICRVQGVLGRTPPHKSKTSLLANAVAASSRWEITSNEVRATLVARTAGLAAKHPGGVEVGLTEQLRSLAWDDPALAHAIVQDEDVIDTLRDMTTTLRDNPTNPGKDANWSLQNLLLDLGLARQGGAPAKTVESARIMARRGLDRLDRLCGGLFASEEHRFYNRVTFESF